VPSSLRRAGQLHDRITDFTIFPIVVENNKRSMGRHHSCHSARPTTRPASLKAWAAFLLHDPRRAHPAKTTAA
jgi:hypothetical protein